MHVFTSLFVTLSIICNGFAQDQTNNVNNVNQGTGNTINSNAVNVNQVVNNNPMQNMIPMGAMQNMPMPSNMPMPANMPVPPDMQNMINMAALANMMNMLNNMNMTMANMTMQNMTDMMNMMNMTGLMNIMNNTMNMMNNTMLNNGTMMNDMTMMMMNNGTQQQQNLNVGNPDQGRIERPCETYDTDCIRRFFAERNKCKIARGPIPDPFYRKQSVVYISRINVTASMYDVRLTGFNRARVEEFYINRDTDKIVLAVEFRNVTVASNRTYLRFHRRGKEPVITKTNFTVTYDSLSLTGIIPQIDHSLIDKTVIFAYSNTLPNYVFGPDAFVSTDPQTRLASMQFAMNPRANTGEILLTASTYYYLEYIQYKICDFGLKVL